MREGSRSLFFCLSAQKKKQAEARQAGRKKRDERTKQHIEETGPRCSYLKINLPRDGTTSSSADVLLQRVVQLTYPPIS